MTSRTSPSKIPAARIAALPASGLRQVRHELRLILTLAALMSFGAISTDIYLPAVPTISRLLHASPGSIELTLSAFLIGFSAGQLVWGPIGDRHGRKLPIAIGLVLFIAGSAGCAMSSSVWQMMGWRVVQALGACVGPVLARAMVRDLYTGKDAARMLSTLILIMGVVPLLGPLLGGQILAWWSWHGIFWTLAIVGLLTIVLLRELPETLPEARRSTVPLRHALSDYALLAKDPRLLGYALSGGFFYGGVYTFIIGTPFVYIDYYHVSPQAYGLLFGINAVGMMATNFLNRQLLASVGSERIFRTGTWILAASGVILIVNASFGWGGLPGLVLPLFVYLSMNGFIVANSVAGALSAFPHEAGTASSLLGVMHYGSGILSATMVGAFSNGTPQTMAWIMGLAAIGSLLTSLLSSHFQARQAQRAARSSPAAAQVCLPR